MAVVTVHDIVSKMTNCPVLCSSWKELAGHLQIAEAGYLETENAFKNGTVKIYNLLRAIVQLWLGKPAVPGGSRMSRAKTVGQLCEVLSFAQLRECAESLLEFGPESIIQFDGHVERTPKQPPLTLGWWPHKKELSFCFVDRMEEGVLLVQKLDDILKARGGTAVISQQACVSGLGGIGKTTLAKGYAHYFADSFDFIVWLDCGEDFLMPSFEGLWDSIDRSLKPPLKPNRLADIARQCFSAMKEWRTLLIYDNAEEYGGSMGIKHVLPESDEYPITMCLITSRYTSWGNRRGLGEIPQFRLKVLSEDESVNLLRANLENVDGTTLQLAELAKALGYHPLALQIAIANLNQHYANRPLGVVAYKDALYKSLLLSKADVDDYEKGLEATLKETAMKVREQGELGETAWNLLCSISYVLPSVPLKFLAAAEKVSYEIAIEACALLQKYSLMELSGRGADYIVGVHRLLQETVKHMCLSVSNIHYSKLFESSYEDDHIRFLWKPYLECNDRAILSAEKVQAVKYRLYNCVALDTLSWEERPEEAECLLDLYHDINQERLNTVNLTYLTFPSIEQKQEYDLTACIIAYLRGHLSYLLKNDRTLQHFADAKRMALQLPKFDGGYGRMSEALARLYSYTTHPPKLWALPLHWSTVILHCDILSLQFLFQQNQDVQTRKQMKGIWESRTGFRLSSDLFPHTFRLDQVVGNYLNVLNLCNIIISYDGAKAWVDEFSNHKFSSCSFDGLKFVNPKGKVLDTVVYHTVLPTNCERISVSSTKWDVDVTRVYFDISHIWSDTERLSLNDCTVLWKSPQRLCKLSSFETPWSTFICANENSFPDMFPRLKTLPDELIISLFQITISDSRPPPSLSNLDRSGVEIQIPSQGLEKTLFQYQN